MKKQLMDKEASCNTCQEHKDSKVRPPPIIPDTLMDIGPMERVSVDVFHSEGKKYLVMADWCSTFRFC